MPDIRDTVQKRLEEVVNRSEPHSDVRVLVQAVRVALKAFNSSPYFVPWCEALLLDLEKLPKVPFVVAGPQITEGAKTVEVNHVGPRGAEAPTFRRWVDENGNPVSLNPTEDFDGSDF